jgi:o-succinylbenzoate synthase
VSGAAGDAAGGGAAAGAAAELAERLAIPGIDAVVPFRVPLTTRFRGVTERHGLLLHGPHGWGEWSPFDEYDDAVAAVWLASAIDAACVPAPAARRERVPVNVTVPAVGPDEARRIVAASGCATAKVKVAESGQALEDDVARVAAAREALAATVGSAARIRVDANAAWSVAEAVEALGRLEEAAGGLEYAEQPCVTLDELAEVRARTGVRIAADEAIRRDHADPVLLRDAVDVVVVKVQPSGGVTAALALVERIGLPAVVSSALDTSIALAAGVRLAAALPTLDHACGLATGLLLAGDVVARPLLPEGGMLDVGAVGATVLRDPVPSPPAERVAWFVARAERALAVLGRRSEEQGA